MACVTRRKFLNASGAGDENHPSLKDMTKEVC
jgi:hypothetical protein